MPFTANYVEIAVVLLVLLLSATKTSAMNGMVDANRNITNEQELIEIMRNVSGGNRYAFHHSLGFIYLQDPDGPVYNVTKAKYHFEESLRRNDSYKATYLYNYAFLLMKFDCHQCSNINCTTKASKRCQNCKFAHYCSRDCQVNHWKLKHKLECLNKKHEKEIMLQKAVELFKSAIKLQRENGFTNVGTTQHIDPSNHFKWQYSEDINVLQPISNWSIHSWACKKLAELLSDKFDDHQIALNYIYEALKYETHKRMIQLLKETEKKIKSKLKKKKKLI